MAFSDARNERDRAETGRNSANHGGGNARDAADRNRAAMFGGGFGGGLSGARGTLSQQQDRRNTATARSRGNIAPGVGMGNPLDSRSLNPRYQQNIIATRPLTPRNVWEAVTNMPTSPIGALNLLGGALGVTGLGPQYEGPVGHTTGYSYDGPNRFGVGGSALFPNQPQGIQPVRPAGQPQPFQPMPQSTVNPAMLSVGGGQPYGVNLPSYGYFGQPGQQRPAPAMFGMQGMPRP